MYFVAEFYETHTVSVLPAEWVLSDGLCYWPPKDATKHIIRRSPNEHNWSICKMQLFCDSNGSPRSYSTYDAANAKAKILEDKTDLSSADEEVQRNLLGRTRNVRKGLPPPPKPTLRASSENFFSINPLNCLTEPLPAPQSEELAIPRYNQTSPAINTASQEPNTSFINNYSRPNGSSIGSSTSNTFYCSTPNRNYSSASSFSTITENIPKSIHGNDPTNADLMAALKNLTKVVVRLENRIEGIETLITNIELDRGTANRPELHDADAIPNMPLLPTTNKEEVESLEKFVCIPGNAPLLVNHLRCVGGQTVEISCKSVLLKLFTDDAAKLLLWTGANGKMELQKMKLVRIIFTVVQKLHPPATEANVLLYIKNWIRRAGDRIRSRNKSKKIN